MPVANWWWTALAVGASLAGGLRTAQDPGRNWLALNGNDWRQMEPAARLAYVDGFLAGAALSQAVPGAQDTAAVRTTLERLKQTGQLRFPFGANVYLSRVSDYYWWKNHLPLPTWYAFLEVNTTLGRPISDSVP